MRFAPVAALLCAASLALALPCRAQLSSIAPFTGDHSETWEGFADYFTGPYYLNDPTDIMGGSASIANGLMVVYVDPGAALFNLGDFGDASVSDGTKGMGVNGASQTTTITFDTAVDSFGAYWAYAYVSGDLVDPLTVEFLDAAGSVIGTDTITYAGDGTLDWHGWASTTPIKTVKYTGNYAVIDGLQAGGGTADVPEPGVLALLVGAGVAGVVLRRRARA